MPDKNRKILMVASAHLLSLAIFAPMAYAQVTQPSNPTQTGNAGQDFFSYAKFFYPFGLSVAAIAAVTMLVIAGVEMMIPIEARRTAAKEKIWSALGGLLLAALSYLILNTINPQLIQLKLNPPQVTVPANTNSSQGGIGSGSGIGPSTPPGTQVDCVVSGKTFSLTKAQCDAQGGSSTGGSSIPTGAMVNCVVNGKTFSITKAECDSFGGSFPIGGGATNLGNGFTCTGNASCTSGFCNANGKCAQPSSAPPPTTNPPPSSQCTCPTACTGGTTCFCAIGQTSGTCN